MTVTEKRNVVHGTFCIERSFDAAPERVFQAFANLESKTKWFSGPSEWLTDKQAMRKILVSGVRGRGVAWSYPEFVIASVER